ncbi:MAG: TfoX/Sxy family DNA transformation protein [Rhodospirillales bacterium]|nr:TfoX/Sxy family DNA transformation protein [Rhodospirillales bacterium]
MDTIERLSDLRNLGPVTVRWLGEVGIETADDLRCLGALDAWRRIKFAFGRRVAVNALLALEGALLDCDWRALPEERAKELRRAAAHHVCIRMAVHSNRTEET